MAKLAFTAGGLALGAAAGNPALGAAAGGLIGSFLFPPDDIVQQGSQVNNQATTASAYGIMRPFGWGIYVVQGNIIDGSDRRIIKHRDKTSAGGKGGSQKVITEWETAERDIAVGLGEGPISGILQIFASELLIWDATPGSTVRSPEWLQMEVYLGTETQMPDPTLESIYGVGNTLAYRGEAYVMFRSFQLEQWGNSEPSFRFVVVKNGTKNTNEEEIDPGTIYSAGNLLQDRNSGIAHLIIGSSTPVASPPDILGWIYDMNSKSVVGNYSWPDDVQLDEGVGAALCGIPTLVNGEPLPLGANSHLVVQVEVSTVPKLAVYDSSSGAFVGFSDGAYPADINEQLIPIDETLGLLYKQSASADGFFPYYTYMDIAISEGQPSLVDSGNVVIPIANRDGIGEWAWQGQPSVPEGTSRVGQILVWARDTVDTKEYLCLIDVDLKNQVKEYVEETGYSGSLITKIVWDSVQELFWVIGESSTTGFTRIKSYDLDLNNVHDVDYDGNLRQWPDYITYDPATKSIWIFSPTGGNILYEFSTTSQTVINSYSGWSGDTHPEDTGMVYHAPTRTAWRKGGDTLFLLQLDRLTVSSTTLDTVLDGLCDKAGMDSSRYRTSACSAITVEGYGITTGGSWRSKINPLLEAYLVYGIDKDTLLDFVPYSTNIVAFIPERDLAASSQETEEPRELVEVRRLYEDELPYKCEVTYYNAEADYEQGSQAATRKANIVSNGKISYVFPMILTDAEGAALADVKLHLVNVARLRYTISIMPAWRWLSAGDLIQFIDDNNVKHTARIMRREFVDGILRIEAERFDSSVLVSFLAGGAAAGRDTIVAYTTRLLAKYVDGPLFRERDDDAGFYLSATAYASTFQGGSVFESADNGGSWGLIKSIFSRSRVGRVEQAMPAPVNHHVWDATTSVTIGMISGELESFPASTVVKGANLALVGAHGRWEAVQFADKSLVSGSRYSVTNWLRGRLGTEHAMNTHQAGDSFLLISTDDLQYIPDTLARLNTERLYRAVSFGADLYGYFTVDTLFTNRGVCLEPYAPDPFRADKEYSTLDIALDWGERSRYPPPNAWTGTASETSASFSLDVKDADGSVVGTYATTGNEFTYARASQVADGFSSVVREVCSFEIFQISDRVGRGYGAVVSGFVLGPADPRFQTYAIDTLGASVYYPLDDSTTGPNDLMRNAVANASDGQYKLNVGTISAQTSAVLGGPYPGLSARLDADAGLDGRESSTALSSSQTATIGVLVHFEESLTEDMVLAHLNLGNPLGDLRMYLSSTGVMRIYGASAGTSVVYATATTTIVNGSDYYLAGSIGASGVKAYVNGTMEKVVTTGPKQMAPSPAGDYVLWHGFKFAQTPAVNKHRAQGLHGFARQLTDAEVSTLNTKR